MQKRLEQARAQARAAALAAALAEAQQVICTASPSIQLIHTVICMHWPQGLSIENEVDRPYIFCCGHTVYWLASIYCSRYC